MAGHRGRVLAGPRPPPDRRGHGLNFLRYPAEVARVPGCPATRP
jgi:hypothetical protein